MTLMLTAASAFVAGMLVEAVVWGRAAARAYRQLRRHTIDLAADRDAWRRAARARHPALRVRVHRNGDTRLRAVDE